MTSKLRLVTRKSTLALWQANHVKSLLESLHSGLVISIMGVSTEGDKDLESSLAKIGGKGLFVKELESYLLENKADIAVHSMKDLPFELPRGLCIGAILERAESEDALLISATNRAKGFDTFQSLASKAVVGSSSLRRQAQAYALRSDIRLQTLRGNVDTRVLKLDAGEFDAVILAVAGLKRLGLEARIDEIIDVDRMLPAVGQGALGIECRSEDEAIQALVAPLDHLETRWCIRAERQMNACLGGSCQSPVAGLARIENGFLSLKGWVGTPDGRTAVRMQGSGRPEQADRIAQQVAAGLFAQGAKEILSALHA